MYAYAEDSDPRQRVALSLIDRLVRQGRCALPAQVLAEFFNVVTRKVSVPLTPAQARQRVAALVQAATVLELTSLVVLEATRGVEQHSFSYYDAQIWAVARLHQISVVLSEDFPAGAVVEGVRFVNPFAPGTVLDTL